MKKLLMTTLALFIPLSSFAAGKTCVLDKQNENLSSFAREVNADCSWSIRDVVEEKIFLDCSNAPEEADVYIRRGKVVFTEYSNVYDVREPYYYCKNSAGHSAYYDQLVSSLTNEVRENSRRTHVTYERERSYNIDIREEKEEAAPEWLCIVPNYILIPRIYTQEEKEILEFTYSSDPRFKCTIVED